MLGLGNSIISSSVLETAAAVTLDYTTNLVGWWDFSDASQMYVEKDAYTTNVSSDGDAIGRVKNKAETTPLGNFLRASSDSERPLYKTGGQNGKSYALFDGTDDHLLGLKDGTSQDYGSVSSSKFSECELDGHDNTMFVVMRATETDTVGTKKIVIIGGSNSAAGDSGQIIWQKLNSDVPYAMLFSSDDGHGAMIGSADIDTTVRDYAVKWTPGIGNCKIYVNNAVTTSGNVNVATADIFKFEQDDDYVVIGENFNAGTVSGYNFGGSIYEVLVYNEALNDTNRGTVHDYLNQKYNLY